ncbi:hypothetical protein [Vogesella sp. LIG4]|uniref:hypothetical protein n=1 Tax=Vogesella sp. LIG4 TaxID=1192162 RepID=UPI0012FDF251|nr:hypothetical protein [Vogesella sp. LIG4]
MQALELQLEIDQIGNIFGIPPAANVCADAHPLLRGSYIDTVKTAASAAINLQAALSSCPVNPWLTMSCKFGSLLDRPVCSVLLITASPIIYHRCNKNTERARNLMADKLSTKDGDIFINAAAFMNALIQAAIFIRIFSVPSAEYFCHRDMAAVTFGILVISFSTSVYF